MKKRYGEENIVLAYYYPPLPKELAKKEFSVQFDVRDIDKFKQACIDYNIDTIINLAAILSAKGEQEPLKAWDTNINGLINTLEIANELKLERVLYWFNCCIWSYYSQDKHTSRHNTTTHHYVWYHKSIRRSTR